ncbi:hypothetical protein AB1Y20_000894 [Prymnesium parvum]|uniref:PPPDE domain-containing protein n=1 Tax=Prymnesium parvum TaxID=97485 RepID=A0AB34K9W9_PRYPA
MNNASTSSSAPRPRAQALLHVYELGKDTRLAEAVQHVNHVTQSLLGAGGVFHAAVEVIGIGGGREWSYGHADRGSGVFSCAARANPDHVYRESAVLGWTHATAEELSDTIEQMKLSWSGQEYHLVRNNCVTFCDELCRYLGVGPVPEWVGRFARVGAGTLDVAEAIGCATAAASSTVSQWLRDMDVATRTSATCSRVGSATPQCETFGILSAVNATTSTISYYTGEHVACLGSWFSSAKGEPSSSRDPGH